MDTIICDKSAFAYWRTPPLVRLLASAPEEDVVRAGFMGEERLRALRERMARETPLGRLCLADKGSHWGRSNLRSLAVRDACLHLAPSMVAPVDVLVRNSSEQSRTALLNPRVCVPDLPFGSVVEITDDLKVASPALALQQIAARATLVQTVLLASELSGSFSFYRAPAPIAQELQRLIDEDALPAVDGWAPCLTPDKKLSDLWHREPLVAPYDLGRYAMQTELCHGRARLLEASRLTVPGAASPFEVQVGVLQGFSRRRGGEGFGGFAYNKRVVLSARAALLAQRRCCFCDIYYEDGLDVECQSRLWHDNEESFLSDADRTAGLELMRISVLPVTAAQIWDPNRADVFAQAITQKRGIAWKKKTDTQIEAWQRLRSEVLRDWASLTVA